MANDGLYVGDKSIPSMSRHRKIGEATFLDPKDLMTHIFVCGASGFGKTVLSKSVVEEAALGGIPCIVLDLKGDLSSMALAGADFGASREIESLSRSILGDVYDEQVRGYKDAERANPFWARRAATFAKKVDFQLFTPKSTGVRPLQLSSFPKPGKSPKDCDEQEKNDYLELMQAFVRAFLGRLRQKESKGAKAAQDEQFLLELLKYAWENNVNLEGTDGLSTLVSWIIAPPVERLGNLPVDMFMAERRRMDLCREVNSQLMGLEPQWYTGVPFDLDQLLAPKSGRTPIVTLSLAHLHDFFDQAFVVAQVCHSVYRWMRGQGGAAAPRLLLFIDEIGGAGGSQGFYPSYPHNPPSKSSLNVVLRQGRAFGVCSLLATQNVIGVDHRGLGNVGTWGVGNLTSANERKRIHETIGSASNAVIDIASRLTSLNPGEFLIRKTDGGIEQISERWLYSAHHVIDPHQLADLATLIDLRRELHQDEKSNPAQAIARSQAVTPEQEPMLPSQSVTPLMESVNEDRDVAWDSGDETVLKQDLNDWTATRSAEQTITKPRSVSWTISIPGSNDKILTAPGCYILGRHQACDLQVNDPMVSRRQLIIDLVAQSVTFTADSGSKNAPIVDDQELEPGKIVTVDKDVLEIEVGTTKIQLRRLGP